LKPTSDGKWAHIVCALAIPEVKFENVQKREPINAYRITSERSKLVSSHFVHRSLEKTLKFKTYHFVFSDLKHLKS